MKFELKSYKLQKTKNYYKKTPMFFVFNVSNLNSKSWLKIEQVLYAHNLKYYKVYNTLSKKFLEKSIFQNTATLINSSICFVHLDKTKNTSIDVQKIINLSSLMSFLSLRVNNKMYSPQQLNKISSTNYNRNVKVFNNSLKRLLKLPYYKIGK